MARPCAPVPAAAAMAPLAIGQQLGALAAESLQRRLDLLLTHFLAR